MATEEQRKLRDSAARVARLWGDASPLEATQLALDLLEEKLLRKQAHCVEEGLVHRFAPEELTTTVQILSRATGSFTNEELLDELFGKDAVVFEPHSVKIEIGRILRGLGYHLKQVRRRGQGRVLAWHKPQSLDNGGATSL